MAIINVQQFLLTEVFPLLRPSVRPSDRPTLDGFNCCSVRCLNLCYMTLLCFDSVYEKQMLSKCFGNDVVFQCSCCTGAVALNFSFKEISLIAFENWHFYSRTSNA